MRCYGSIHVQGGFCEIVGKVIKPFWVVPSRSLVWSCFCRGQFFVRCSVIDSVSDKTSGEFVNLLGLFWAGDVKKIKLCIYPYLCPTGSLNIKKTMKIVIRKAHFEIINLSVETKKAICIINLPLHLKTACSHLQNIHSSLSLLADVQTLPRIARLVT